MEHITLSYLLLLLLVVHGTVASLSSHAQFNNCNGHINTNPIFTDPPVLVNTSANGKLYVIGGAANPVNVLHLYGTPYQMGFATGTLLKHQIRDMFNAFFEYIDIQTIQNDPMFKYIPKVLREIIERDGIEAALEYEVVMTSKYVPSYFDDEIKGIADGAGLEYGFVRRVNMYPELIKAACSILGAWGKATTTGGLMHLRGLDWGTENPFRLYPLLTVYHPTAGNGHPFAVLGWPGIIGALTGYSPYVGAGEKVWIKYNGTDVRQGIPWNFLFREMLQYDKTVGDAIARIQAAHRTCSIFLGIGDHSGTDANFKIVEYSHDRVEIFGDNTPFPGYAPTPPQHPLFNDVVYADKHSQPSKDPCMGSIIQQYYGSIDAQSIINLVSLLQSGDMHAAIYDYKNNTIYVAVATQTVPFPPPDHSVVLPAYTRQFIQLNMNELFNVAL